MSEAKSISISLFRELVSQQREDFSSIVNSIMKSFNDRFDKLHESVVELKHSLTFSQSEIDNLKETVAKQDKLETNLLADIEHISMSLENTEDKLDYLENQSRRNNIRFDNIPEDPKETWDDTETKVRKVLESNMGFKEKIPIERAHRVGKGRRSDNKPRSIVVKFLKFKDRESVLKNGSKLKGTNIFAREDLSERILARRASQMEEFKDARRNGKIAYFVLDKLVVKDRPVPDTQSTTSARSLPAQQQVQDRPTTRSQSVTLTESVTLTDK